MMTELISFCTEAFPQLLSGLLVSIEITAAALAIGLPLGLAFALLQRIGPKLVVWPLVLLVELGRGAPALIILYLAYFGLPEAGVNASAITAAIAGLAYSTAAYTSEMFRAALQSVPPEQLEAADSIGLKSIDKYRYIVLPTACRIALPPVLGFCIVLFQGTSLCFAIAVPELLSKAYNFASITFQYLPALSLAGLIYAFVAIVSARFVNVLERRLSRHL